MYMLFDPLFLMLMLPGLAISLLATFFTRFTFSEYSKVTSSSRITGAEASRRLLDFSGIYDVRIEHIDGLLSDHYDPTTKTLRLSSGVYSSPSLSAIGVACHEAGHAIQHAQKYYPLALRSSIVPAVAISSNLSYWIIIGGFIFSAKPLIMVGALFFSMAVLFAIITLPVEWDASARAKKLMVNCGIVSNAEAHDAGKVLNAAFMTYLASALTALMTLIYYLMRAGIFGSQDD